MKEPEYATRQDFYKLWYMGSISWLLWPQQLPIYDRIRDLNPDVIKAVILCARQFGKSFLGCVLAIEDCLAYRDRAILIVGPTIKQTRDIVFPRVRQIARTAPPGLIKELKSEDKFIIGECELIIGGFDNNASSSQRGKTLQNIYVEEIVDSKPDQYNDVMRSDLAPALMHSRDGRLIFLTTPPKIPDHPFLLDTVPEARLNNSLYVYTIDDNKELTPEQYDRNIELAGGINSIECQRELFCRVVRDTSLVAVPSYNDVGHVTDRITIPLDVKWMTDIDWGGVRDKTVALLHYWDPIINKRVFHDEVAFENNTPTSTIVREVLAMERANSAANVERAVDAAGQQLIDLKSSHNFTCAFPKKGKFDDMVKDLDNHFYSDKVLVNERCSFLRESLRSGVLVKSRNDFERTHSLGHCDAIAAAMYAVRREKSYMQTVAVSPFSQSQFSVPEISTTYKQVKKFGVYR